MLTVAELIDLLSEEDPDMKVLISVEDENGDPQYVTLSDSLLYATLDDRGLSSEIELLADDADEELGEESAADCLVFFSDTL